MKSVLEYLNECKQMADHNRFCYSATYGMDTPKPGYETEFQEAVRDGEIVDELINIVLYPDRVVDRSIVRQFQSRKKMNNQDNPLGADTDKALRKEIAAYGIPQKVYVDGIEKIELPKYSVTREEVHAAMKRIREKENS